MSRAARRKNSLEKTMRLLLLSLAIASPAMAAPPFQDTVALDRAVAAFTGRAIGDDGGARTAVDNRLKLSACPTLSLAWRDATHDAVVVNCTGPEWRIFVPVRTAYVAPMAAPAATPAARAVMVIRRGDPVTISAGSPGFSITREGVALADAASGAHFLVKVDETRTPVQAVALQPGRATLPGWSE